MTDIPPPGLTFKHGPVPGALGRVVQLHGSYYARHWSFGLYFESLVAEGLISFLETYNPERELFLTVWDDTEIPDDMLGSLSVQSCPDDAATAQLRWVILSEQAQGRGIGAKMMTRAMSFIRQAGYSRASLNTFRGLDAARRLYERNGFILRHEEEAQSWGIPVREQHFINDLRPG